ncbi:hypothetical protein ABKN59_000071 [Abortiporus biennis]
MIHLDRNHSSIAPHNKSNLIYNNPSHAEQHISNWSPPRDERSFYAENQEQPMEEHSAPLSVAQDASSSPANYDPVSKAASSPLPRPNISEPSQDFNNNASAPQNNTTDASSPAVRSNSTLTPPPDSSSPVPNTDPVVPPSLDSSNKDGRDVSEGSGDNRDKASHTENHNEQGKPNAAADNIQASSAPQQSIAGSNNATGEASTAQTRTDPPRSSATPDNNATSWNPRLSRSTASPTSTNLKTEQLSVSSASHQHATTSNTTPKVDPKVVAVLELNNNLFKVTMELQARGIPPNDPRFQQYSMRLQSNLTWLAAAADENRKPALGPIPLPSMQPPPPMESASMNRLQALYTELPILFAAEIARRQSSFSGQPTSGMVSNGMLKRERSDELSSESGSKRRDTGETKMSPPPSSSASASGSTPQPPPGPSTTATSPQGLPGASGSSPAMPPPSVPPGIASGQGDPQMAIARERARQMQMRQAMQHNERQMSPSTSQQSSASQMNMQGSSSSIQQQQLAAISQHGGPAAVNAYQILQTPTHPIVQYLTQSIPNFASYPLAQQLSRVQMMQAAMHARSQQQGRSAGMQPPGAAMTAGFGAGGMPSGGGAGVPGPMSNSSPPRMSPVSQAAGPSHSGQQAFPFAGSNMDPRMSGLTSQQQATLTNMNPQQRQLFLMQQQQMMRGGNPAMMNPQMLAAAQERMQQQRLASSNSPTNPGNAGLPGGMPDNPFPALRSNPGVPGIARSTRTPSDHAPSPMTPQMMQRQPSQTPEDLQRMFQHQRSMMSTSQDAAASPSNMQNGMWSQGQQASMGNTYGMNPPGGGYPSSSSPAGQNWSQGGGTGGGFPMSAGSPVAGQTMADIAGSRQTSMTPAPNQQPIQQNSPSMDQSGLNDFDIFNWTQ